MKPEFFDQPPIVVFALLYVMLHVACILLNIFLLTTSFVRKRKNIVLEYPISYIFFGPFWTYFYFFGPRI